jgi:L-ribulose-5-phosphate 3-epimerase UlaE
MSFTTNFGIMQGRLLSKFQNRYQAHPIGYWKEEFTIAKEIGLSYIEFILDQNDCHKNPLMSDLGIVEIEKIIQKTGVGVRSVCADIFMEAPLHSENNFTSNTSKQILLKLIENSAKIGITDIVIPCVDQSTLKGEDDQRRLIENLSEPINLASKKIINLALETDLAPIPFLKLINKLDSDVVKVNYDIGNSASLGYDIFEEFKLYGNRISDIHIKDRELGGGSVVLGTGNANFKSFFEVFSNLDFKGPIVMQVYRDDEGVEIFKKQFDWFKLKIKNEYDCNYTS